MSRESGGTVEYMRQLEDACLILWAELPTEQTLLLRAEMDDAKGGNVECSCRCRGLMGWIFGHKWDRALWSVDRVWVPDHN